MVRRNSVLLAAFVLATSLPASADDAVILAAGDVADCTRLPYAEATAKVLDATPGTIAVLGDLAYPNGNIRQFRHCYQPTWGRHRRRTKPAPGNHEYNTPGAAGYYQYWGPIAGGEGKGYYSYDEGDWHVVVLNSNCAAIGGCNAGSPQETWLRADLAAHPAACTLAYWHHPLFSSGPNIGHAQTLAVRPLWQALYDGDADLILNGHEHNYERFAPQDPNGVSDPARGLRQFVVGTGGKDLTFLGVPLANSEIREWNTFGVLKLTLHASGYDWAFLPVAGSTFQDSGSGVCH